MAAIFCFHSPGRPTRSCHSIARRSRKNDRPVKRTPLLSLVLLLYYDSCPERLSEPRLSLLHGVAARERADSRIQPSISEPAASSPAGVGEMSIMSASLRPRSLPKPEIKALAHDQDGTLRSSKLSADTLSRFLPDKFLSNSRCMVWRVQRWPARCRLGISNRNLIMWE